MNNVLCYCNVLHFRNAMFIVFVSALIEKQSNKTLMAEGGKRKTDQNATTNKMTKLNNSDGDRKSDSDDESTTPPIFCCVCKADLSLDDEDDPQMKCYMCPKIYCTNCIRQYAKCVGCPNDSVTGNETYCCSENCIDNYLEKYPDEGQYCEKMDCDCDNFSPDIKCAHCRMTLHKRNGVQCPNRYDYHNEDDNNKPTEEEMKKMQLNETMIGRYFCFECAKDYCVPQKEDKSRKNKKQNHNRECLYCAKVGPKHEELIV